MAFEFDTRVQAEALEHLEGRRRAFELRMLRYGSGVDVA